MPRRAVPLAAGRFFHVYNRGVDRRPVFFSRENALYFLRLLRRHLEPDDPAGVEVVAYCLMPNHFHLLVRPRGGDLGDRMGGLAKSYTQAVNRRRGRVGPLFQGRFKAKPVDDEAGLVHLSRYVHLNPVAAGLAGDPLDWAFFSLPEYAGTRRGSLPSPDPVFAAFEGRDARRRYLAFVRAGVGRTDRQLAGLTFEGGDASGGSQRPGPFGGSGTLPPR